MVHKHEHEHGVLDDAQLRIAKLRAEAKARGEEFIEDIKDRGGDLVKEAQTRGQRAWKDSKLWIIENPAQAVGIAFAAGAIASTLFRRRED